MSVTDTCRKCGGPKESTRQNSNLCRACDHGGGGDDHRIRTTEELIEFIHRQQDRGLALIASKNRDYGDHRPDRQDPFANIRRHGEIGVLVRIDDKLSRLNTFLTTGKLSVDDESVIDSCLDAMNYIGILMAYMYDKKEKEKRDSD